MGTFSTNILPSNTGQDLGSPSQRWDAYLQSLDISGGINANVTGDLIGDVTSSGISYFRNINAVRFADQFPGADAGAKIVAAIADLPSTGGMVDARGLYGAQSITVDVFSGVTKPVFLGLGAGTYSFSTTINLRDGQIIAGVPVVATRWRSATNATVLSYTGSSSAIRVLPGAGVGLESTGFRDLTLDGTSSAAGTNGLVIDARAASSYIEGLVFENVTIRNFPNNQVYLDGTTFDVTFRRSSFLNPSRASSDLVFVNTVVGDGPSQFTFDDCWFSPYSANTWAFNGSALVVRFTNGTVAPYADRTAAFTAVAATDIITSVAHGHQDGDIVRFTTTGTLPAGLSLSTDYWVRDAATDTFKVAATVYGAAINITTTGTGVHSFRDSSNGIWLRGGGLVLTGTSVEGIGASFGSVGIRYSGASGATILPGQISQNGVGVQIGDPHDYTQQARGATVIGNFGNNLNQDIQIVAGGSRLGTVIYATAAPAGVPTIQDGRATLDGVTSDMALKVVGSAMSVSSLVIDSTVVASGKGTFSGGLDTGTLTTGTAPIITSSTTECTNLNAETLQGRHLAVYVSTLTPALVAANTVAAQSVTVTGATTAWDILQVIKPTEQAGLAVIGARVTGANTVSLQFANCTGVGITPTAGEVYRFVVIY